ncbi:YhcN/YlaJ family sporulation lipoprotein [Bacillus sp. FJAT-50079]|uniref:YhcN/YlaJ family sporulation lipoprotein n=1 Tax=Bacillus sp. FJAT-50079 TaxID=2833577 RepID=UPI001BC9FD0F|nr:YhcN/YlaJ family sporulation lipoprotein [Bacillus sp. FJAT-50079]MBS4208527.1 YhcN/YlaJ family sporulation lipoprotein [Bacillus sp. FJAT-50079]
MKLQRTIPFLATIALLTACGTVAEKRNLYEKGDNTIHLERENEVYNQEMNDEQFGFVRQVKTSVTDNKPEAREVQLMNREEVANNISKIAITLPNVVDASVLVTDQEVLVAYEIHNEEEQARFETADQVKKIALSAVPRWYHIYVTDDPSLRQNIANIASLNTRSTDKDETVKKTVKLMLERSPQGRHLNDGENANGETNDRTNFHLEKNDYRMELEKGK